MEQDKILTNYALESQIWNLSRRILKTRLHLERNPNDLAAKKGMDQLLIRRASLLEEMWQRDFGRYKAVHLKCESLFRDLVK